MIKVVGLLTRKPAITHEQFVMHWLKIHGPLAHAVPGIRRYVQSHIVGTRTRPDIPATDVEVDGIAEILGRLSGGARTCRGITRDEAADRRRRAVHRPDQDLHHRREADHSYRGLIFRAHAWVPLTGSRSRFQSITHEMPAIVNDLKATCLIAQKFGYLLFARGIILPKIIK